MQVTIRALITATLGLTGMIKGSMYYLFMIARESGNGFRVGESDGGITEERGLIRGNLWVLKNRE